MTNSAMQFPNRILAGPILRRAGPGGVWIWFCFRQKPVRFSAHIVPYLPNGTVSAGQAQAVTPATADADALRTVRIGANGWVTLLHIRPAKGAFPYDQLLGYDIDITLKDAAGVEDTFRLTAEIPGLAYRPFKLPTFFLSSSPRRIAQGSCRRPGGAGPDAHLAFDAMLSDHAGSIAMRPYAYFLTGDQIYADDVAEVLFHAVSAVARAVCGYDEEFVAPAAKPLPLSQIPEGNRRSLALRIGFSTQDEGHLFGFSEYAAMYLMVWGPELYAAVDPSRHPNLRGTRDGAALEGFHRGVVAARRVMANVPTYMIFDDHDVTDDWNIDGAWFKGTRNGSARLAIGNALFAYFLFQGWGNDPNGLGGVADAARQFAGRLITARGRFDPNVYDRIRRMETLHVWTFVPPVKPSTLVLDTRTQRRFPPKDRAILVGPEAVDRAIKVAQAGRIEPGQLLLLVTPAPLYNLPMLGYGVLYKQKVRGRTTLDLDEETFSDSNYGRKARAYLLQRLHKAFRPKSVIALSGDVHHSFIVQARQSFVLKGGVNTHVDVLQVTSSPIKNVPADLSGVKGAAINYSQRLLNDPVQLSWNLGLGEEVFSVSRQTTRKVHTKASSETYLPLNNICLVDFSEAPASVHVVFIGHNGVNAVAAGRKVALNPAEVQDDSEAPGVTAASYRVHA